MKTLRGEIGKQTWGFSLLPSTLNALLHNRLASVEEEDKVVIDIRKLNSFLAARDEFLSHLPYDDEEEAERREVSTQTEQITPNPPRTRRPYQRRTRLSQVKEEADSSDAQVSEP